MNANASADACMGFFFFFFVEKYFFTFFNGAIIQRVRIGRHPCFNLRNFEIHFSVFTYDIL